jgi:hypothetical protein
MWAVVDLWYRLRADDVVHAVGARWLHFCLHRVPAMSCLVESSGCKSSCSWALLVAAC